MPIRSCHDGSVCIGYFWPCFLGIVMLQSLPQISEATRLVKVYEVANCYEDIRSHKKAWEGLSSLRMFGPCKCLRTLHEWTIEVGFRWLLQQGTEFHPAFPISHNFPGTTKTLLEKTSSFILLLMSSYVFVTTRKFVNIHKPSCLRNLWQTP